MKIGVDIDEIVTEFVRGYLELYNHKYNKNLKFEELFSYNLWEPLELDKQESIDLANEYYNTKNFENVSLVEGAEQGIKSLNSDHELIFITARPEHIQEKTKVFFKKIFPDFDFEIIYSKGVSGGKIPKCDLCEAQNVNIFIEDNKEYALECAEKGIKTILFDKPWNKDVDHENIIRVFSWEEILNKIKEIKTTKTVKSKDLKSETQKYFDNLDKEIQKVYETAKQARSKGLDPEDEVEIPIVKDLAERVVGLISVVYPQIANDKIVKRIEELEKEYGMLDHTVALKIAEETALQKYCKFENQLEAIDAGIRIGFAYITVGVVASPLEGYTHFELKKTQDNKDLMCVYYSGPIRSAGGTAASFSILIADHLREVFGYAKYDPVEQEVKRTTTEIFDYHDRVTNLQYVPSEKEMEFLSRNLPVQIDGSPSEDREVSNYKDLPRVETNFIRSGVALVLAEGLAQKAHKILKILKNVRKKGIKLSDWDWLEEFVVLKDKEQHKLKTTVASATYISDIVAGRPVLSHPSRQGGFRLRYGKCRTAGLSSMAMSPLSMTVLKDYIGVGTQLKYEGPGKSSAMSLCDDIEGPIIKLEDGSVVQIDSFEKAEKYVKDLKEVLFLGDFLVNYAEYFNRGKHLQKPGYCEDWYSLELEKLVKEKLAKGEKLEEDLQKLVDEIIKDWRTKVSFEQAVNLSKTLGIALYPKHIFYWDNISKEDLLSLIDWINHAKIKENIILPYNKIERERFQKGKRALELIGVEHKVSIENVIISESKTKALLANLGIKDFDKIPKVFLKDKEVLEIIDEASEFKIKDKSGSWVGARMGRPEKAKLRKLTGSPNVLFPIGEEGGRFRSVNEAVEVGSVNSAFPINYCNKCKKETIYRICEDCNNKTIKKHFCRRCNKEIEGEKCEIHDFGSGFKERRIDMNHYFKDALNRLGLNKYEVPGLIKGVRGTSSKDHDLENLAKGILRAKYGLCVNKDGTIRYDLTEMPLTHFKPKEIGTSVEKLRELGYTKDKDGKEIVEDNQLIEIFPQDIILPACPDSKDEKGDDVFLNISNYIDELLVRFYDLESFYKAKSKKDVVGQLVLGLAPHTSAGIIGRIIGFTKTQACLSSPMWHAAMRRDCEGDETCVMSLLDAFINFSKKYLPSHRGATQDAPLVATSILVPAEIDDMAFDIDVVWKYPLELFEAALEEKDPWEIKIEQLKDRLGTEKAYLDFGFTHNVDDLNNAVVCSAYKSLPTMQEKVHGQMWIAEKLRSVDTGDVARLIIDKHFMRDIKGNLRKFSQQGFRCVSCNEKFRRPPLTTKCTNCGGKIIFTVSFGGIIKYLEPALDLTRNYDVPAYIKQDLLLTKKYIESIFGKDNEKQESIDRWF